MVAKAAAPSLASGVVKLGSNIISRAGRRRQRGGAWSKGIRGYDGKIRSTRLLFQGIPAALHFLRSRKGLVKNLVAGGRKL
jgi:hypothetical protein